MVKPSTLEELYLERGGMNMDGFSKQIQPQVKFLKDVVMKDDVKQVMEIGFNAGHSSELFLETNPNVHVTSFDIVQYNCVNVGKKFIDEKFPNRHTLIKGDSLKTVPEYASKNNAKFDVIFIDGGHTYEVSKGDIINCKPLAHKDTVVIMDDTIQKPNLIRHWNNGPNQAWLEAKTWNIVKEEGCSDFESGRGHSWGKYVI